MRAASILRLVKSLVSASQVCEAWGEWAGRAHRRRSGRSCLRASLRRTKRTAERPTAASAPALAPGWKPFDAVIGLFENSISP